MKYLILLLLLTGCVSTRPELNPVEYPKYKINQVIYYKVPESYLMDCNGVGKIKGTSKDMLGGYLYKVETDQDQYSCPTFFEIREDDIIE